MTTTPTASQESSIIALREWANGEGLCGDLIDEGLLVSLAELRWVQSTSQIRAILVPGRFTILKWHMIATRQTLLPTINVERYSVCGHLAGEAMIIKPIAEMPAGKRICGRCRVWLKRTLRDRLKDLRKRGLIP